MTRIELLSIPAALACLLLLAACETPLERAYGLSQREYASRMVENPEAGLGDVDAPRPDGASAASAADKFRENESTVDESEPESVINIDIGN